MISNELLNILICPKMIARNSEVSLTINNNKLFSNNNNYSYNIVEDIPDLRIDQGKVDYDEILNIYRELKTPEILSDLNKAMDLKNISGNVLVAGAGTGTAIAQLKVFNPKLVVAVDYSNFIRKFKNHMDLFPDNTVFLQADLCNLPIKKDSFDFVISDGVLHQTRTPEQSFRHLYRVLKPGGRLNLGHLYIKGAHNNLIDIIRSKYLFHEMNEDEAYSKMKKMLMVRRLLKKIGLSRLHRKLKWPMYIHISHLIDDTPEYAFVQAKDYYRARYRHTLYKDDIFSWYEQLGMTVRKTQKGWEGIKV